MIQNYKYHRNLMKIQKSNKIIIPNDIISNEIAQAYYINKNDFYKLNYTLFDNIGRKYKYEKNIRWLFKQQSFIKTLTVKPTYSQMKELKNICHLINNEVVVDLSTIAKMVNNGVKDNFYRRFRLSYNLKSSDSRLNFICLYGYEKGIKLWKAHKVDSIIGDKNVAYNHAGKYSPWSKKSKFYSEESKEKCKVSRKQNNSNNSSLSYYTSRGYTLEEAEEKLSERQSTFSLNKCIEKYGYVNGTKIWEDRQVKWQNVLQSKSLHEIEEINKKKGLDSNGTPHTFYNSKLCERRQDLANINSQLYYVKLTKGENTFYKIGITKYNSNIRLGKKFHGYKVEILYAENDLLKNIIAKEQYILRKYEVNRLYNPDAIRSTECFNIDIFHGDYKQIANIKKEFYETV